MDYPFGQHRWVEYSNIHDFDATMIQPEWHGWMHHTFDETPVDAQPKIDVMQLNTEAQHVFPNHVGHTEPRVDREQVNLTQYR